MQGSLAALVRDLEIRAATLLDSLPTDPAPEISQRVTNLRARVQSLLTEAQDLLTAPLDAPEKALEHFHRHVAISRRLLQCEWYDLPILLRWAEPDRLLTSMCNALLDQVEWKMKRPLVSAMSISYFWALPSRSLIGVPANEHRRLLGVGDLCHELGHLAFFEDEETLVGDTPEQVWKYVQSSHANPPDDVPGDPGDFFSEVQLSWRTWLQEFTCDAVATYLVGPAFAWQHLRLFCLDGQSRLLFEPLTYDEHPADDARMRVSLHMLQRLEGMDDEAQALEERWDEVLRELGTTPDPVYPLVYDNDLLEAVAANAYAGCARLGLRPYQKNDKPCDVATLANDAWSMLRDDPDIYAEWEEKALSECHEAWAA